MFARLVTFFHPYRVFLFLVAYRWASLIPGLLALGFDGQRELVLPLPWVFGIALFVNLFISLTNRTLNRLVIEHPGLIGLDLVFSAGLLAVSGGAQSPYYLYALSPLLAGAFFFQMHGALAVSTVFTPLYIAGSLLYPQMDVGLTISQVAGIWLIPILFAYPSILFGGRVAHDRRHGPGG